MLFWPALAFAVVATVGSAVYAALKGLELFRRFKRLSRAAGDGLERITRSTGEIETHLQAAAAGGTQLGDSLARLSVSRARLNVLTSALADVRAAVGRVTSVYPRK